jgi:16S rRNA (uracil1498-N3)-methyltransferase
VLRLKRGDHIVVFNGRGTAFEATVESARKNGVHVAVGDVCKAAPEARVGITLVQSVLKGDKMDGVVRDAVMIGVAAIQPIVTQRTEVSLPSITRGRKRERWERIAVSSSKQCGRAVVPAVLEPVPFEAVPTFVDDGQLSGPALMLVEPRSEANVMPLRDFDGTPPREASILIGPEGGWSPEEIDSAAARCHLVTFGDRTIRGDAMGLVAVAALFAKWREY